MSLIRTESSNQSWPFALDLRGSTERLSQANSVSCNVRHLLQCRLAQPTPQGTVSLSVDLWVGGSVVAIAVVVVVPAVLLYYQ